MATSFSLGITPLAQDFFFMKVPISFKAIVRIAEETLSSHIDAPNKLGNIVSWVTLLVGRGTKRLILFPYYLF